MKRWIYILFVLLLVGCEQFESTLELGEIKFNAAVS